MLSSDAWYSHKKTGELPAVGQVAVLWSYNVPDFSCIGDSVLGRRDGFRWYLRRCRNLDRLVGDRSKQGGDIR
jgi:hypothetical protein